MKSIISLKPLPRRIIALAGVLILLINAGGTTKALTSDDINSIYNDTVWYDPSGSSGSCGTNLVGSDNEEKIWNYLIGRDLSQTAVGALMGNFEAETAGTWDPRVNNGGELTDSPISTHRAYGIVQWLDVGNSGGRQTNLVEKAAKASVIPGDLGIQLDFMWDELSVGYKSSVTDKINASGETVEAATQTVYDYYEGLYGSGQGSVDGRTKSAKEIIDKYKSGSGGGSGSSGCTCTLSPGSGTNLNIAPIVSKYNLQSVLVKQIGGSSIASANEQKSPTSPASVMKLIVADVFLHTNPNLAQQWTVKSQDLYGVGDVWPVGSKVSLETVLKETLNINSSNEGANILIDAAGGLSSVNTSSHSLGYSQTDIVARYHDPPAGSNKTTVIDLTKAIETIYTASGSGYQVAKNALQENYFGISPAPEAAKWGMNGSVTGNSGIFDINGSKYVISLYINKTDQKAEIKGATEDIIASLDNQPAAQPTGTSNACSGNVSAMLELIKQYAWPSAHTPATEPTQAYLDATKKAQAAGRYTGADGGGYPGIDCGGFVTRVMQDSGIDPGYGAVGNTIGQEEWLKTHPDKYQLITVNAITDLQPGDIAIKNTTVNDAHTMIYVGNLSGFNGNTASASLGTKAPAAVTLGIGYFQEFSWYRIK